MGIREILTVLFVSLGLFFATVSVIGTIRQKDFLSYLQIAAPYVGHAELRGIDY